MALDKYMRAAYFARFAKNHNLEPMELADLCRLADAVLRQAVIVANAGVAAGYHGGAAARMERACRAEERLRRAFDARAKLLKVRPDHAGQVRPCLRDEHDNALILPLL